MDEEPTDSDPDSERIYHRSIEPDTEDANYQLLHLIADLEGVDVTDLPPMWKRIDDLVNHLFDDPPSPDAQTQIEFSYFSYRITLDQSGSVSLMKLSEQQSADP